MSEKTGYGKKEWIGKGKEERRIGFIDGFRRVRQSRAVRNHENYHDDELMANRKYTNSEGEKQIERNERLVLKIKKEERVMGKNVEDIWGEKKHEYTWITTI